MRRRQRAERQTLSRKGRRFGASKSEHFFDLSEPASRLLLRVEAGDFDSSADAHLLYDETDPITFDIQDLITHWSMATGRDMKATTVTTPA
jgi:hypothetical protein